MYKAVPVAISNADRYHLSLTILKTLAIKILMSYPNNDQLLQSHNNKQRTKNYKQCEQPSLKPLLYYYDYYIIMIIIIIMIIFILLNVPNLANAFHQRSTYIGSYKPYISSLGRDSIHIHTYNYCYNNNNTFK